MHASKDSTSKVEKLHGIETDNELKCHKNIWNYYAGKSYVYTESNKSIITSLIYYFNGIYKDYDLNKGIALIGSYGVGKTTIFNIFKLYLQAIANPNPNLYRLTSVDELITTLNSGDDGVFTYNFRPSANGVIQKCPINILINEFAYDLNIKHFGSDSRYILETFLMKRYEIFTDYGKLTHITTNLDTDEIKKMFPEKLTDRFREMFNVIELKGKSFRK